MCEEKDYQIEARITYQLPYHENEYRLAMDAKLYYGALMDIYNICRTVWKYEEKPSEDRVRLAEEIGQIAIDAKIWEIA